MKILTEKVSIIIMYLHNNWFYLLYYHDWFTLSCIKLITKITVFVGYGLLFAHSCEFLLVFGDVITWNLEPLGQIYLYDAFYDSVNYFNYDSACFKFKDERLQPSFCEPPIPSVHIYVTFKTKLIGVLSVVNIFFFFMTIFVYAILPLLHNLHGKCLMCYIFSLAMSFFTLANINLNPLAGFVLNYFTLYLRRVLGMTQRIFKLLVLLNIIISIKKTSKIFLS